MASLVQHSKHVSKIPRILKKNFTLIFRNWQSLVLLILGPLILMFLIGIVSSTYDWSGISVGIVHEDENVTTQFAEPISAVFGVYEFRNESSCIDSILREKATICIVLSDSFSLLTQNEFSVDNLPSGKVTFVFDNSKTLVSNAVVGFMRQQFGITSDQITIESIGQLLSELEYVEVFLENSIVEIGSYRTSLEKVNDAIIAFEQTILIASTDFENVFEKLNQTRTDLESANKSVQDKLFELDNTLSESDDQLQDIEEILEDNKESYDDSKESIESSLNILKLFQTTFNDSLSVEEKELLGLIDVDKSIDAINSDGYTQIGDELSETLNTISNMRVQISEYEDYSGQASDQLPDRIDEFSELVEKAEEMNDMLASTKLFAADLRNFTDSSAVSLGGLYETLENTKLGFKNLENINAQSLVSPVTIEPKPLVDSESGVYLLFPLIIPVIIVFLSVLFSNIIMIDEIYSKAQIRNFILPVHDIYFIVGFFLTNWIIVLFQISVLFIFAKFALQLAVLKSLGTIFLTSILLSSVFILIGMIFAYVASSKEISVLASTFLTIAVLFLSDSFIPTELMDTTVAFFVRLNPLVVAESIYRIALFHDFSFSLIAGKIFVLVAFILVLFALLISIVHRHRHLYRDR